MQIMPKLFNLGWINALPSIWGLDEGKRSKLYPGVDLEQNFWMGAIFFGGCQNLIIVLYVNKIYIFLGPDAGKF